MRLPRFSIAGLMALTALIVLDCLATRVGWDSNDVRVATLYFGVLPWLNVLLIGLAVLRGRRRRCEPAAFLVGFEAFGWAVLAFSVTLIFVFTAACESAIEGIDRLLGPLMNVMPPLGFVAAIAIAIAILTLPQLIAAVAGGLLTRHYRLVMERRRPRAIPSV